MSLCLKVLRALGLLDSAVKSQGGAIPKDIIISEDGLFYLVSEDGLFYLAQE